MSSWEELRQYIHSNYQVADDAGEVVRLLFDLGNGRSQNLIWTPVCDESQIPARQAVLRSSMPLLSLSLMEDGTVILSYSALLKDLDVDEFEIPLRFVTQTGDSLEREFAGVDRY
jgi:hypothetical protein